MKARELVELDLRHFWHPCTQMKDCESYPPMPVESAAGSYIILKDGRKIIDGISSWWCKSLGHSHPRIKKAFIKQLDKFEHVMMANFCAEPVAMLCDKLSKLCPPLDRVFLVENGSVGVEVAMKMSLQFHAQTGHPERNLFAALENGYHGETLFALAAGDCSLYSNPFKAVMPKIPKLGPIEYLSGNELKAWNRMDEEDWKPIETELESVAEQLAGVIVEPVLQGSGGMLVYSPDLLRRLKEWTSKRGLHLIADEMMTGYGRTGKMLACEHAGIAPDFLLLSKGITGGYCPLAAVVCSSKTFEAFYADYLAGKMFIHSTTYGGYAPAAAAALEVLRIYEDTRLVQTVQRRSLGLRRRMEAMASATGALRNVRAIGFMAAADLFDPSTGEPFPKAARTGFQLGKTAAANGALIRPLGDTVYFMPPLNTEDAVLDALAEITTKSLKQVLDAKRA